MDLDDCDILDLILAYEASFGQIDTEDLVELILEDKVGLKYLVVIGLEATCGPETSRIEPKMRKEEIIDFSAVILKLETGEILSEFQAFVKPTEKPILSDHCKNLTGITQDQVDKADPLWSVLIDFNSWLKTLFKEMGVELPQTRENLLIAGCALASWTNNDFQYFLSSECERKHILKPDYFNFWFDVKIMFMKTFPDFRGPLNNALAKFSIAHPGREHSGLNDARKTARLAYALVRYGVKLEPNDLKDADESDAWYLVNSRNRPKWRKGSCANTKHNKNCL